MNRGKPLYCCKEKWNLYSLFPKETSPYRKLVTKVLESLGQQKNKGNWSSKMGRGKKMFLIIAPTIVAFCLVESDVFIPVPSDQGRVAQFQWSRL